MRLSSPLTPAVFILGVTPVSYGIVSVWDISSPGIIKLYCLLVFGLFLIKFGWYWYWYLKVVFEACLIKVEPQL